MTEYEKKGVAKKPIQENNNTEQSKANPVETERHNSLGELWEEIKHFKELFTLPRNHLGHDRNRRDSGPRMNYLLVSVTNEEETFESALQFFMFLTIWLLGSLPNSSYVFIWLSPVSSVLLMAKSRAENMLVRTTDERLKNLSFLRNFCLC